MHYSILNPLIVFLHLNQEILLAKLNFYSIFMVKIERFKPFIKEMKKMLKSLLLKEVQAIFYFKMKK